MGAPFGLNALRPSVSSFSAHTLTAVCILHPSPSRLYLHAACNLGRPRHGREGLDSVVARCVEYVERALRCSQGRDADPSIEGGYRPSPPRGTYITSCSVSYVYQVVYSSMCLLCVRPTYFAHVCMLFVLVCLFLKQLSVGNFGATAS